MGNGILAQAAARLPSSMGGTQSAPSGALRNVPASFTGGQGQSLGIYQPPKKRRGGGGGGFRFKPKKKQPPKGLVDDWKKTLAQLQENVNKGYISSEQAKAIENKLKPLYEELGQNYGEPHKYSQELKNAISKYGNIRDGVDYETVKALRENPTNLVTGKPNIAHKSNYPDTPETVQAQLAAAKEAALARGDWNAAEELGASTSEIIARGGVLQGTKEVAEGPEFHTVNVWGGEPAGTNYIGDDGQIQSSAFDAGTEIYDDFQTSDGFDTAGYSDFQSSQDTSYNDPWSGASYTGGVGYTDAGVYGTGESNDYGVGSYDSSTGYGGFNRGGIINYKGSGGMPAQRGNPSFPGEPMGTDTVPMYAEEGEFVMTREATEKFRPQLEAMNKQKPPSGTIEGAMSQLDDLINQTAQRRQR